MLGSCTGRDNPQMTLDVRRWWSAGRDIARDALEMFSSRGARLLSGSIAFYALVSVVPILVIALRVAGALVGEGKVAVALHADLARWVGNDGASTVLSLVAVAKGHTGSSWSGLLSALVLVYASTRLFSQLTRALDLLWDSEAPESKGIWASLRRQLVRRSLAFFMVLVIGLLLVGDTLLHMGLAASRRLGGFESFPISRAVEAAASFGVAVALFSLMFRLLPRARVTIRDAAVGGAVTALLFTLGSLAITAYVTRKDVSLYGAASSMVMLLMWVNYSAHVFFLGASFTRAHSRWRGTPRFAGSADG